MLLHLYRATPEGSDDGFVLASGPREAADIYITYELAHGRQHRSVVIEVYTPRTSEERDEDHEWIRVLNTPGVVLFDKKTGWRVEPPG
jgi:hypothetical protein